MPSSHRDIIVKILKSFDLGNPKIVENEPWILLMDTQLIKTRLKALHTCCIAHGVKDLPFGVKITSLVFNEDVIIQLVRSWKKRKLSAQNIPIPLRRVMNLDRRVSYFCEELDTSPYEIISKLDVHPHHLMIIKPLHDIQTIMKFLKEELIFTKQDILQHRRLFSRRMSSLRSRVERLKSIGMPVIPHLLSSGYHMYQPIQQSDSVPDVLRNQLNITQRQIVQMTKENKTLIRRKPPSLQSMIQMLSEQGYLKEDIVKNPKVLTMNPEILEQRLRAIEPIGKVVSLQYLRYRERKFNQLLEDVKSKINRSIIT